ncbi:V-type ATP synthase subunit E [Clostridium folliculivorans]|uniref:V-type proton ATPase subunit E n=1 Tax=Clostridium folliculivorans TaxID=2886038 RepID=A0A9W5Y2L9_9CLOT|nr:V-type ATP synthase subunit E family protein [Clostridium folliculivorans]GKU25599.1 V-type ATP synthase subunit E [Clostridium folliculivorans]GKU28621.1 V-type ATP synthase subunit E [Clostridium folliculivorans]
MAKIDGLINKILEDAEAERDIILKKAEAESNAIIKNKIDEAKEVGSRIIEKANIEAGLNRERIISNTTLKVRNEKLVAKQKVMSDVFNEALDELCAMSKESFLNYLKATIISLKIDGDEEIILNIKGREFVDGTVIAELNNEFMSMNKQGNLRISERIGGFKGGFILEKNGIEINNTFEALINSYRDELEFEIADILFN